MQVGRVTCLKDVPKLEDLGLYRKIEVASIPRRHQEVLRPLEGKLRLYKERAFDRYWQNCLPLWFHQTDQIPDDVLEIFLQTIVVVEPGLINEDGSMLNTTMKEVTHDQLGLARAMVKEIIGRPKKPNKEQETLARKMQDAKTAGVSPETMYDMLAMKLKKTHEERSSLVE